MIWSGWLEIPNMDGIYVYGSVMDSHISDFTHSYRAGDKNLPKAKDFHVQQYFLHRV